MSHAATTVSVELLKKYDRPGPRYTSYPTVPVWTESIGFDDYARSLEQASMRRDEPLAIYCHIPFCTHRCYYCGCNTVVTNNQDRIRRYVETLSREIDNVVRIIGRHRPVSQLHFGGGTPLFLDTAGMTEVLNFITSRFTFQTNHEQSIELDPRVTKREQLEALRHIGFNRVSFGVQDFDADVQKAVGRIQPFDMVAEVLKQSRSLGFRGINADLIYGLPLQKVESFSHTLDQIVSLRPDRLAVYSFAYLPKSLAHQNRIDPEDLPTTDVKYRLFATAIEKLTAAGYLQIGMDHFALPDDELAVAQRDGRLFRNFMGYTVQQAPEMIGFGMSAIGYIDNTFFQSHSKLDSYGNAIAERGLAIYRGMRLGQDDLIRQYVITQLMCNFTLSYQSLQDRFGVDYFGYFANEHQALESFVDDGLLTRGDAGLHISTIGRTFVRNIAMTFDTYLNGKQAEKTVTFSRTI
ncbi:MAG: oxygen-independent coproporphyrinogen III oxidase [candidate division Zixibacteria bacterium]|nr:oxygen-independent coproporphyrinogen III oxidase [candidate division Zixibacteria bacterium]